MVVVFEASNSNQAFFNMRKIQEIEGLQIVTARAFVNIFLQNSKERTKLKLQAQFLHWLKQRAEFLFLLRERNDLRFRKEESFEVQKQGKLQLVFVKDLTIVETTRLWPKSKLYLNLTSKTLTNANFEQ